MLWCVRKPSSVLNLRETRERNSAWGKLGLRDHLDRLGVLAEKVGTALFSLLDFIYGYKAMRQTYKGNEAARGGLLLGRAAALEVLKAAEATLGNVTVESGELDVVGAALGVDVVLAGTVGLQGEERRGSRGHRGGRDSQGAQGDGNDAGSVHYED